MSGALTAETFITVIILSMGMSAPIVAAFNFVDTLAQVGTTVAHLSGGERQRIAIARAILKDAPIIVLDEATAYIDPENEDRLQKAIEALLCTVSVIRTVFPGGAAPPA